MEIRSLGYRTDFIFHRQDDVITNRGDYLVVRTPSNPTFYWGNYLLFAAPPGEGDFDRWHRLFAEEIGTPPAVHHHAFAWDTTTGEEGIIAPFIEAGFTPDYTVILATDAIHRPAKYSQEVVVRPLPTDDDADWEQATRNQVVCRDPWHDEEGFTVYKRIQMARYREMARKGLGQWFGAFLGERLVGDLGLFGDGSGLARFQSVGVDPDFRRRGICGAMVYQAARYGLDTMKAETLVMAADENYHAARIYESVGFRPTERNVRLTSWPRAATD